MKVKLLLYVLFNIVLVNEVVAQKISLKNECYETLTVLSDALLNLQITDANDHEFGALKCPSCNVLHTRAAEAVYPFSIMFKETRNEKYLHAAIFVTNWLIKQQQPGGEWIETPWAWTGTTADQLLMITNSYPILKNYLTKDEQMKWENAMKYAADFLVKHMSPDFASINYCPTSAAVLVAVHRIIPDSIYLEKARSLAHWTVAKMDEAGFIQGEAARSFGVKYGVDLGYEIDMSLWGLGLYAKLCNDKFIEDRVKKSLAKNLNFVYPNGAIDGSWGSRCYKWATFGSKTADGCQILFSMYAEDDPRYVTAAIKNLRFLRTMIKDGMIGNGPHFWDIFPQYVCNYPTFARAKNLAMAYEFGIQSEIETPPIPSEIPGWMEFYPTVNVALARSQNFMLTVSAYGYKDLTNTNGGQYNQHPTGGSACNIWVEDFGFLQTSSQTKYVRGETMHMPVIEDTVICLTPRIEFTNENGYFTNLYEFEGRITAAKSDNSIVTVTTTGELKNEKWYQGGVGYTLSHKLFDNYIEKRVKINFHDRQPLVRIIEPIVQDQNTKFEWTSPKKVFIKGEHQSLVFEIVAGDFQIEEAELSSRYMFPFPAMKCFPLVIKVHAPVEGFEQEVKYRITILD